MTATTQQQEIGISLRDDARTAALTRIVFNGTYEDVHMDVRAVLLHPLFDPRPGLTADQAGRLAYERARLVHGQLERPTAVLADPRRLFALAEWPALLDVSTFSLLMVHYNLCLGTVVDHAQGRNDLADPVRELDELTSFGPYMATELGFGNNVAALRTEAVYDHDRRGFVLNTPEPAAQKHMSYSGFQNIPKVAVVMARLKVAGKDWGVFPFVVRLSDEDGLRPGISSVLCPEKPVQGLDNGLTWFDNVELPLSSLLCQGMGQLTEKGVFVAAPGNQRSRFLRAMSRIQPGRICVASSAVAAGRASVYIAVRFALQRLTNAPGSSATPVIVYRSHQVALFTCLAKTYAMTVLLNHVKREFLAQEGGVPSDLGALISITKALATWEMTDVVAVCRERCGAQGIFSVNRIADYGSLLQGLVTAEGDNQVLLGTTAGQLAAQRDPDDTPLEPPATAAGMHDLAYLRDLLRFRERALHRQVRDAMADSVDETYFSAWNRNLNKGLAMARARGARTALECLLRVLEDTPDEGLHLLARLYGCAEVQRESGWFVAKGALPPEWAERLGDTVDELAEQLVPHAGPLVDAFQLTPELLRAPLAADDYMAAFLESTGANAQADRASRRLGVGQR